MNEYLGCLRGQRFLLSIRDVHVCRFLQVIAESDPKVSWQTNRNFGEVQRADFLGGDRAREWGVRPVGKGTMNKVSGDGRK